MQAPMPSTSGLVGGIGGSSVLAIPDVKLLSGIFTLASPSTSGLVGGIGGNSVLAIPDVKLLSGIFTLPSPLTSGIRAASAGMLAS